ncbi:MAG: hypothetical protein Q9160_007126 [Pyrenula sp. 1 TL-2023]
MEVLTTPPKLDDFVSLVEHQSSTPASFYNGPAVLHYQSDDCRLRISEVDLRTSSVLSRLDIEASSSHASAPTVNGDSNGTESHSERIIEEIQVWVASNKLLFWSTKQSTGASIPYPSISLHAIQSLPHPTDSEQQGLYMQMITSSPEQSEDVEDEEPESISLTVISPSSVVATPGNEEEARRLPPTQALFNALSACSNLHPDPVPGDPESIADSTLFQHGLIAPGAEGGGLPPPMPGSGGWITADNMDEYFDENGNWIGGEQQEDAQAGTELGSGAGTTRAHEDVDGDDDAEAEGENDETKWRRTS